MLTLRRSLLNVRSETSPKIPTCLRRPGERSYGRFQKDRSNPAPTREFNSIAERGLKGIMARLIVTVYLFLLLTGLATAQEQKLQRLNVVWSTIGGTTSSLWVTKDAGIFA